MSADVVLIAGVDNQWSAASLPVRARPDGYGGIVHVEASPATGRLLEGAIAYMRSGSLQVDWERIGTEQCIPSTIEEFVTLVGRSEAEPKRSLRLADGRWLSYAFFCSELWDLLRSDIQREREQGVESSWRADPSVPFYTSGPDDEFCQSKLYLRKVRELEDIQRTLAMPWKPAEAGQYTPARKFDFVLAAQQRLIHHESAVDFLRDLEEQIREEM